ncbi:MAG: NAD(P)H-dependent glycerol-3-phosphate dehydrogenase [Bacteroidia bacterium]
MSNTSSQIKGVIGAGSFGTVIANVMAENGPVLMLARRQEVADKIMSTRQHKGQEIHPNITLTTSHEEIAERCEMICPVVPSASFGKMLDSISPFLKPSHILIHATKGLDIEVPEGKTLRTLETIDRTKVKTMSELIYEKTVVRRVGCIAGPNLAREIAQGQPAATVVASPFEEVVNEGMEALRSSRFRVHASRDLRGIELAGVLKNIMAIASGMLTGLDYGHNTRAILITGGLAEMATLGKAFGADPRAFLGLAGIGDLVATCYSPSSRNHTVGYRLAKGEKLEDIIEDMEEVAEGVKTICIAYALGMKYRIPIPMTHMLHKILFQGMDIRKSLNIMMDYPIQADVGFI